MDAPYARFVNGTQLLRYNNGFIVVALQVPRIIPFDGVVPKEQSRYPGLTDLQFTFVVDTANHQNIYRVRRGVDQMAAAMRKIGMRSR